MSDEPKASDDLGTPVHWGVAGTGGIAERFLAAMTQVDGGEVVAVGSRSSERGRDFAARHGIGRVHGSYDDLVADDEVDVIYVAVPHSGHRGLTVAALEAGRHVLCEKPMALDLAQTDEMIRAAEASGRFLMEAVWSRFLPSYRRLAELLAEGRIGTPRMVDAELGFRFPFDPAHRVFDPALGGGSLLDLGIYPLQLATLVLGPVSSIEATGRLAATGVEDLVAMVTTHEGGIGVLRTSLSVNLIGPSRIIGDEGEVVLAPLVNDSPKVTIIAPDWSSEEIDCRYEGDGLRFEIDEVHRCLAEGSTQSPTMPWSESRLLADVLGQARSLVSNHPV